MIFKKFLLIFLSSMLNFLYAQTIFKAGYPENFPENKISQITLLDTIISFPAHGAGIAWDGHNLWERGLNAMYKMTTSGKILKSFSLPDSISGLGSVEWDGQYLWLCHEQEAKLTKIDTMGNVLERFNLPSSGILDPNGWGLAWDGQYLWHSEYGDSVIIYKLDPVTGAEVSRYILHYELILGITWANGYLYGININPTYLYKFDIETGITLDSSYVNIDHPLGLTWDGANFWNIGYNDGRIFKIEPLATATTGDKPILPEKYMLKQNYPNPFNPSTVINFRIENTEQVLLELYNSAGQKVRTLVNRSLSAGNHQVIVDGSGLASGIYLYRIEAGEFNAVKKMILLK